MKVALIDYGAGNLTSVRKALTFLRVDVQTPQVPADLADAMAIIVPGVGHFQATTALDREWRDAILKGVDAGRALLGICLGMQWLFDGSAEAPDLKGLGLMMGTCSLLGNGAARRTLKVPHVGWNSLHRHRRSWAPRRCRRRGAGVLHTLVCSTDHERLRRRDEHGATFASVVERDQICGVQFHPEKSGDVGLTILRTFLSRAARP